ncbi:MAG: pilus assembly protein TadE [Actinomycetales bacterium]|nr:MAG: pilus assembly protein TadE [Actinomycetales bacterium]
MRLALLADRLLRLRRDSGRAIVEFLFLGVLVLVPLAYLIVTLAALQGAAYSATTAAREAARAFTTADTAEAALPRAQAAAALSYADFGHEFGVAGNDVIVACDGMPCLRPEGRVSVTATITVQLPFVPDFVASAVPATVPVSATHVSVVDRFRGS